MDDTVWIDKSRCRLQDTVNLAQEFFTMWDIKININKCELLVINPSVHRDYRFITMGEDTDDIVRCTQKEIRYLGDRKSTRLNSSHRCISYAVFCLKKKT